MSRNCWVRPAEPKRPRQVAAIPVDAGAHIDYDRLIRLDFPIAGAMMRPRGIRSAGHDHVEGEPVTVPLLIKRAEIFRATFASVWPGVSAEETSAKT